MTPPICARCHRQIARVPLPTGIARAIGSGWQAVHRNRTGPVSIHHNGIGSVRVSEGDRFAAPPIRLSPNSRRTHADEFEILSEIAALIGEEDAWLSGPATLQQIGRCCTAARPRRRPR